MPRPPGTGVMAPFVAEQRLHGVEVHIPTQLALVVEVDAHVQHHLAGADDRPKARARPVAHTTTSASRTWSARASVRE